MPALGLTDHGVMNGAVELYQACGKHGVKPIIGLEAYLVDDVEEIKHEDEVGAQPPDPAGGRRDRLPEPRQAQLGRFPRGLRPRQGERRSAMLERYSEGVIALTGCLQSRFCRRLVEDRPDEARAHADDLLRSSAARTSTSSCRSTGSPSRTRPTRASSGSRASSAGRWSGPPTFTTCGARTTATTRRCSACRPSRRSRRRR